MDQDNAVKKIEELKKEIQYHANMYYNEDNPIIEDYEYDALVRQLEELEAEFPQYTNSDSITQTIGGVASSSFTKIVHTVKMESLANAFSKEEIETFMNRVSSVVDEPIYIVEPKVDGLSVNLVYINGVFTLGATRGNGTQGEDVTQNLKTIKDIPPRINTDIEHLEIRGEVYMSKDSYRKLVEEMMETGEIPFKNPRNAAAGSLRQKDPHVTATRELSIAIFNLQVSSKQFSSHIQSLEFLKKAGFNTVEIGKRCSSLDEVYAKIIEIDRNRSSFGYDIDGAVVKLDNLTDRMELGSTAKAPRWAIAFKYPPEVSSSILRQIEIQVGRTGVLTPIAIFDPIILSGTTVSRASLHNEDYIASLDIRIGDTIDVHKAADIIPEVVKAYNHKENSLNYEMPKQCPSCNSLTARLEGEAARRCINPNCKEKIRRSIIHFVSRDAMDIDGLGPQTIDQLISLGMLPNGFLSLYDLKEDDLLSLEKIQEKSSNNLLNAIDNSKQQNLNNLIYALGIRGVGSRAAFLLASHFESLDQLACADIEDIAAVEGIGYIIGQNIFSFFRNENNISLVENLKDRSINTRYITLKESDTFSGMSIVVTGTLNGVSREEANSYISKHGGKPSSGVSKRTTYVVAGENAGSKFRKANELGIPVITWEDLILMTKNES